MAATSAARDGPVPAAECTMPAESTPMTSTAPATRATATMAVARSVMRTRTVPRRARNPARAGSLTPGPGELPAVTIALRLGGRAGRFATLGDEAVAAAPHRLDRAPVEGGVDLASEVPDVDLDDVRVVLLLAPHVPEQVL